MGGSSSSGGGGGGSTGSGTVAIAVAAAVPAAVVLMAAAGLMYWLHRRKLDRAVEELMDPESEGAVAGDGRGSKIVGGGSLMVPAGGGQAGEEVDDGEGLAVSPHTRASVAEDGALPARAWGLDAAPVMRIITEAEHGEEVEVDHGVGKLQPGPCPCLPPSGSCCTTGLASGSP